MRLGAAIVLLLSAVAVVASGGCVVRDDDPTAHDGGVGDECSGDHECREMLNCVSRTCQPRGEVGEGGYCELTADCVEGLYCAHGRSCAQPGATAEGGSCATTADCEAGLVCVLAGLGAQCQVAGENDIGEPCDSVTDCLAGLTCPLPLDGPAECAAPSRSSEPEPPPAFTPWVGERCVEDNGPSRAYFEVPGVDGSDTDFYRLPFPNDLRRLDGQIDLSGHPHPEAAVGSDIMGQYLEAIEADVDGFARNAVIYFRFSSAIDYDTIRSAVTFVNVTEGSPDFGEEEGFGWYATTGSGSKYICENWLALSTRSGRPLRGGETYAVILSTDLVPRDTASYERSEHLDALLADQAPDDATLAAAWEAYSPLRAWLTEDGRHPATVLNAAVFTTQRTDQLVPRLQEVIRERPAPALTDLTVCETGVTSPCDNGEEGRACGDRSEAYIELHGRLELPIFQNGEPPYETPDQGGAIELDADGRPVVARTEDVCVAITIPRVVAPPDGFPVVLYAHGTGGSFRHAMLTGVAEWLAQGADDSAVATVAIDLPQHGDRRGGSDQSPEVLFFNFANPRAARDNVIQGAADLMSLAFWAQGFSLPAEASPTGAALAFDPAHIGMFAHSQGATHAALMIPFEEALLAVVLSGEGGHLTQSLLNKTEPVNIAAVLPMALADPNRDGVLAGGGSHPALALFQTFFEVSDPVNYGPLLQPDEADERPARHLMMTYGLDDSYSPEATQRAYARSAWLTLVEPVLTTDDEGALDDLGLRTALPPLSGNVASRGESWTMGMRQYEPDEGDDGHFVSTQTETGRADTLRFLLGALSDEVPQIGE